MAKVELIQGTKEWLDWRKTLVTASDTATLLGIKKWGKTPLKLWQDKMGFRTTYVTPAMERGIALEPKIREMFISLTGIYIEPACYVHDDFPFLGASLDGINEHSKIIVEIKTGQKELFLMVMNGEIPDYYMPQVQSQFSCAGEEYKQCYFTVLDPDDDNNLTYTIVDRDEVMIAEIRKVSKKFHVEHMITGIPPVDDKVPKIVRRGDELKELTDRLAYTNEIIAEKETIRQRIIEICDGKPSMFYGWELTSHMASGGTDYKKMIADHNIDMTPYKKPKKVIFTVKQQKPRA